MSSERPEEFGARRRCVNQLPDLQGQRWSLDKSFLTTCGLKSWNCSSAEIDEQLPSFKLTSIFSWRENAFNDPSQTT